MKKLLLIFAVLLALTLRAVLPPMPPPPKAITFSWDWPSNELSTNLHFLLYMAPVVNTPLTNYVVLTNIVGTNASVTIFVVPSQQFYFVTASNTFWDETIPSEVISTPFYPTQRIGLSLRRGTNAP